MTRGEGMNQLEEKQLEKIKVYAENVLLNDKTGHNMDHIYRVVNLARKIQEVEGGDLFTVLAGAYLHDVMDDKLVESPEQARVELTEFLKEVGLEKAKVTHLFEVIDNVSFSHQLEKTGETSLSLEAMIVQDADRLDAIGAIGIGRTFYYGGRKGHEMHNPAMPPRDNMTKEDYRVNETVINHFYEKLFKLKGMMNTEKAIELAERRHALMEQFVADFLEDWNI